MSKSIFTLTHKHTLTSTFTCSCSSWFQRNIFCCTFHKAWFTHWSLKTLCGLPERSDEMNFFIRKKQTIFWVLRLLVSYMLVQRPSNLVFSWTPLTLIFNCNTSQILITKTTDSHVHNSLMSGTGYITYCMQLKKMKNYFAGLNALF